MRWLGFGFVGAVIFMVVGGVLTLAVVPPAARCSGPSAPVGSLITAAGHRTSNPSQAAEACVSAGKTVWIKTR